MRIRCNKYKQVAKKKRKNSLQALEKNISKKKKNQIINFKEKEKNK